MLRINKLLIAFSLFFFALSACTSRYWEPVSPSDYYRYETSQKEKLNDFRQCNRDITIAKGSAGNYDVDACMEALGYIGDATKSDWW